MFSAGGSPSVLVNGDTTYEANQQFLLHILSATRLDPSASVALQVNNGSAPADAFE